MSGKYRQTQNKSRSRFYIFLSIVFVAVMIKWGIPLFMNLVAGNGASRVDNVKDIIPPQEPLISALPEATNSSFVTVEGYTENLASVELLLNDLTDKITKADESGLFSLGVVLSSGQNRIQVRAKDEAGNESMSGVSLVTFDNKPVELVVTSPKDGNEYFGKLNQVIDIKGSVDKKDVQVLVNNSFVSVNSEGNFVHRIMLSDGENTLTIKASDKAGNMTEKALKIIYTP